MGRLLPLCPLYLLISPQSLVCWLAFLCPSLCPFMQDIISHCWTLSACPQTERYHVLHCARTVFALPLAPTRFKTDEATKWSCPAALSTPYTVRHAPLSVRSTVSPNVAWRRHRLTLLILVLVLLLLLQLRRRRWVDIVAVVNSTASGHAALLFNSNNNFWFVSLHF